MKWMEDLYTKYQMGISNAFILKGNIEDYGRETLPVFSYLKAELFKKFNVDRLYIFDLADGLVKVNEQGEEEVKFAIESYDQILKELKKYLLLPHTSTAVILRYPEFIFPMKNHLSFIEERTIALFHKILHHSKFINSNNIVIFMTESEKDLNPLLISSNTKTTVIHVPLPNFEERLTFIDEVFSDEKTEKDISNRQIAQLTAGLSLVDIEDIYLVGSYRGKVERNLILERKKQIIRKEFGEIIELMDTKGYSLKNFAGQDHLKQYFKEAVIEPIHNDELDIVPKGVLLSGPPGTGKTYFCKCLAGDAGINFVEFKMSKILDKYVGQAEKNLEKALGVFRALAPVAVFIDEADQALQRGRNDTNSVNRNLFGMILAEMSRPENRGKILWLGATNYPNQIDEALKRAGRFDKKIPFFAPDKDERNAVFAIHFEKTGFPHKSVDLEHLAILCEGYTQAEIENVVTKTLELVRRSKKEAITHEDAMLAYRYIKKTDNEKIKEMEKIALEECNDREFLPKRYRENK